MTPVKHVEAMDRFYTNLSIYHDYLLTHTDVELRDKRAVLNVYVILSLW